METLWRAFIQWKPTEYKSLNQATPATISVCLLGVTTTACTAAPGLTAASAEPTPSTWTSTAARPAGPAPAASRTEPARTRIKVALYYIVLTPNNVLWSDCGTWGKKGFCRSGQYVNYMRQNCKKTCKLCWWLYCTELRYFVHNPTYKYIYLKLVFYERRRSNVYIHICGFFCSTRKNIWVSMITSSTATIREGREDWRVQCIFTFCCYRVVMKRGVCTFTTW